MCRLLLSIITVSVRKFFSLSVMLLSLAAACGVCLSVCHTHLNVTVRGSFSLAFAKSFRLLVSYSLESIIISKRKVAIYDLWFVRGSFKVVARNTSYVCYFLWHLRNYFRLEFRLLLCYGAVALRYGLVESNRCVTLHKELFRVVQILLNHYYTRCAELETEKQLGGKWSGKEKLWCGWV